MFCLTLSSYDTDNEDLKYAYWDGTAWIIQAVDSGNSVDWNASLVVDATGHPHISYYDTIDEDLNYATWDGATWLIQTVDSEGSVGRNTSLVVDTAAGRAQCRTTGVGAH